MPMPQWTQDYTLGNRRIDQEHQKLMELLLWLERELLLEKPLDSREIGHLISELDEHVNEHFRHEEVLMTTLAAMPAQERQAHRQDHDRWRIQVKAHLVALARAPSELEQRAHLARTLLVGKAFWEEHFEAFDRKLETYFGS